jgi:hypothetical protein
MIPHPVISFKDKNDESHGRKDPSHSRLSLSPSRGMTRLRQFVPPALGLNLAGITGSKFKETLKRVNRRVDRSECHRSLYHVTGCNCSSLYPPTSMESITVTAAINNGSEVTREELKSVSVSTTIADLLSRLSKAGTVPHTSDERLNDGVVSPTL